MSEPPHRGLSFSTWPPGAFERLTLIVEAFLDVSAPLTQDHMDRLRNIVRRTELPDATNAEVETLLHDVLNGLHESGVVELGPFVSAEAPTRRDHSANQRRKPTYPESRAVRPSPSTEKRWTQQLPDELATRFDYLHDLGYGAQATVLLCRQRTDGQLFALKLYHPRLGGFNATALESLRRTDPAHVAPILDTGLADERVWELCEYFPLGSIRDMAMREGLPLSAEDVVEFVRDLAAALTHIHGLGIIHRDLKPENILVRNRSHLDCVLSDLGLAQQLLSRQLGSVASTFHYTAPETTYGQFSRAGDWWSLGVIAHELLTGRHMFTDGNGAFLPEPEIRVALNERTWAVTGVTDSRFQRLFDGLIAMFAEERWGTTQVTEWLKGNG